eukprot:6189664-Pleurochrysis_carterae.AAC.1
MNSNVGMLELTRHAGSCAGLQTPRSRLRPFLCCAPPPPSAQEWAPPRSCASRLRKRSEGSR